MGVLAGAREQLAQIKETDPVGLEARSSESLATDPRAWVDVVLDDEFPLSIFYTSLQQKLDVNALRSAA